MYQPCTKGSKDIYSYIHDYYEPEELVGKTLIAITNLPLRQMMGIDSCGMIISVTHIVEGREGLNVLIVDVKIPAGAKLYERKSEGCRTDFGAMALIIRLGVCDWRINMKV